MDWSPLTNEESIYNANRVLESTLAYLILGLH